MLETYLQNIKPLDQTAMQQAQAQWNRIAKPLHSLGRLEDMVIQLAGITGSAALVPRKKAVLIFCADNGIIAENVTQSDNYVTAIVTENFTRGITSVNALSRVCGADVYPVDIGIAIQATLTLIVAGTLAGFFPAKKAVSISPIEALRAD